LLAAPGFPSIGPFASLAWHDYVFFSVLPSLKPSKTEEIKLSGQNASPSGLKTFAEKRRILARSPQDHNGHKESIGENLPIRISQMSLSLRKRKTFSPSLLNNKGF